MKINNLIFLIKLNYIEISISLSYFYKMYNTENLVEKITSKTLGLKFKYSRFL